MVTVKNKKELEKAIQNGEKEIAIDSFKLLAACKLASECQSTTDILRRFAIDNLTGLFGSVGEIQFLSEGTVITITITVSICITAIAILAILKGRELEVEGDWKIGKGRLKIK